VDSGSFVFQFYSGGILNSQGCGTDIDHSVVAIGYGVNSVKGEYYIIKSYWGKSWASRGTPTSSSWMGLASAASRSTPTSLSSERAHPFKMIKDTLYILQS